jgi:hypothetical protein
MTFCFDFWSFSIVCILFGLSLSAWIAVTSPLLVSSQASFLLILHCVSIPKVDLLGLELLTSAFGILTFLRGVAALLGPPLAGFVIDATSKQSIKTVFGECKVKYYAKNPQAIKLAHTFFLLQIPYQPMSHHWLQKQEQLCQKSPLILKNKKT